MNLCFLNSFGSSIGMVNVNEHTSGNINMCSSYITPDMCYTSLNPGDEFEGDLEVKSEPESEDGSLSIVQNLTTVYDNQMTTTTLSKAQTEEIEDEPMVDLNTVCLSQEVIEYKEFENKPALLLLVENNHTPSSTKILSSSINNSAEVLLNEHGNLKKYQKENNGLSNNSLTKTLRKVKRKCLNHEAKLDSSSQSVPNSTEVERNLSRENSPGFTSQTRSSSPESSATDCNWIKSSPDLPKSRKTNKSKDTSERFTTKTKQEIINRRRVRNQKINQRPNKNNLTANKLKESNGINEPPKVKKETPTNVKNVDDKLRAQVGDDKSKYNILTKEINQSREVSKRDYFVCTVCNKTFKEKSHLATHARAHNDTRNFKCNECGSTFKTKPNLYFHLKTHEEAPFVCEKCNKIFPERKMLVRHIRVVHRNEGDFKCDQCGRQFKSAQKLELHYSIHTGKKSFSCEVCGKSFVYKSTHAAHMKAHKADREFQCELCPVGSADQGELRRRCHHFSNTRPWLCTVCGKGYPLKSTLKNHMKVHELEKPFKCNECGKSFMKKYSYECHMKVHSGEQPQYMCDQCSQSYFNYFALKRHYLKHISERKFFCDVCKKAFWTKDALKVHKRSHESLKLFDCTQCSKSFAHKHTLVAHMKQHSAESQPQPHSCSLCFKTFVHKYNMSRHKCQSLPAPQPLPPSFVLMAPPKHLDFSTLHIL